MKRGAVAGLILVCGYWTIAFAGQKPETLAGLKVQAAAAAPQQCVRLCAGVARRALLEAKDQFEKGAYQEARTALQDLTAYADKAANAAIGSRKHEKELEIDLRDISHRLDALKRDVSLEDQAAVADAMSHLETLRTQLLQSMFGKKKK